MFHQWCVEGDGCGAFKGCSIRHICQNKHNRCELACSCTKNKQKTVCFGFILIDEKKTVCIYRFQLRNSKIFYISLEKIFQACNTQPRKNKRHTERNYFEQSHIVVHCSTSLPKNNVPYASRKAAYSYDIYGLF